MYGDVAYLFWGVLHDVQLEDARAAMADLAADEDLRHEAAMRRSEKLRAIGSEASSSRASRASMGSSARSGSP
jgi:hypothetical protein